ncbi:LysM peptidoglycan-binding domain-containing protein [Isoptericola croceus]|uniref:LysM peptidoglycan-binding domain-containing protein n=1 Tax=Isoptericola croceus TaxID=3031406 RepID=UPI0023F96572|nr:LysM peptidoglycan-binding domain-containing protein [Isoptericola croceus]
MSGLLAVLTASLAALALLGLRIRTVAPADAQSARTARVETWVELLVLVAGAAGAAWLLLGAIAALAGIAAVRQGRPDRTVETVVGRWAPGIVRRLARGALGAGLGAGLVLTPGTALAHEAPDPGGTPAVVLELGWESTADDALPGPGEAESTESVTTVSIGSAAGPQAAGDGASPAISSAQRTSHQDDGGADEIVVKRGDTLWDIAARELPGDATPADVLRAVTSWHDTNRDVIGDDPDLILPGQVLRAP